MSDTFQTKVINKFRTVNVTSLPFRLAKDEVAFAVNMDFLDDYTIKQRPGSELVANLGVDVQIFKFDEIRDGVVTEHMLAFGGGKGWRYNGTGFDEIVTGMTDSPRYGGSGFIGSFVFSNGTDLKVFKWDTSDYAVSDIADSDAPTALLWAEFQNRLFGCKDGTENLYWSDIGAPEAWTNTNFIALGAMPLAMKSTGEYLFIGTDRGIKKLSSTGDAAIPFKMDDMLNIGVVPNTMQEINAGILGCWLVNGEYVIFNQYAQSGSDISVAYGAPVKDVLYSVDLSSDEIMSFVDSTSGKVIYSMKTEFPIENVSDVFASVDNNNLQLVLNNTHMGWTFYNMQIRSMAEYSGDIYFSDYSGGVHKFDKHLYRDNEEDFISKVITQIYDEGRSDLEKGYRSLWLSSNSNTKTQIDVSLALGYQLVENFKESEIFYAYGGVWGSSKWGEFIWGGVHKQTSNIELDVYSTAVQFIFEKNYPNADMQITDFTFTYVPSTQEV